MARPSRRRQAGPLPSVNRHLRSVEGLIPRISAATVSLTCWDRSVFVKDTASEAVILRRYLLPPPFTRPRKLHIIFSAQKNFGTLVSRILVAVRKL